ncbi:LysR substrate-binding domain-containing protein [Paracoccus seriniphilus]|uniref:LysR family transcriptional regulator, glycine cleavage system transcriptional activator n=1 Tax=Paracoccus seriniphilus TaxID=184748 RepID=A0A239Q1X1_9RHOB|nr:LysR substrate-binding domain-containing protein [Paracoccus seriniphilus]WCR16184.1 LysR family transcriptional regulator [Paracoccus seriniphilus]SNT76551.1 LysR family transcriptional regulator, glycine cleavage system transcriptional activator [Paracoccus seriniphilus]
MLQNLPYTALRTFEAVARLRGFGRAAEELGVTQSSVSQQVKVVEEWIGRSLLTRGQRKTTPTAEGQQLADAVASGLGQIADLCNELRRKGRSETSIVISVPPGLAVNWLFARLIKFDLSHGETPVSISTDPLRRGFVSGQADCAILYGFGDYPGLHVERLLSEKIYPVCSPKLLEQDPPLNSLADLSQHTLLVDNIVDIGGNPPTWSFWAEQTGQTTPEPARTRKFGQANMVVQAAIQGLGVALGREPLVNEALADGSLMRPFEGEAMSQFSYWFVCPQAALKAPHLRRFRDWLFEEADLTQRAS